MKEIIKNYSEQNNKSHGILNNTKLLINEFEKSFYPEVNKLTEDFKKDMEKLEKEKTAEIAEHLKNHGKWHKLAIAEIKIQQKLPKQLDYSNPKNIKKHTKYALLKQARILHEEKLI